MAEHDDVDTEPVLTKTHPAWVWSTAIPEIALGVLAVGALIWWGLTAIF